MSRNNTGNPIGSKAFADFEDNVKNLDEAVNTADPQWVDRFGRFRLPLMEQERQFVASQESRDDQFQSSQDYREDQFQISQDSRDDQFQSAQSSREAVFSDFLQGSGYQDLGEYAPGIEITAHNQYVTFGGQPYLLKPSIPVPYTTSGGWTGDDFKLIGDDSLRQDLANPDKGALMVRGAVIYVNTIADLQALDTSGLVDGQAADVSGSSFKYESGRWVLSGEFVTVEAYSDHATETDWAPAFRAAVADGRGKIIATQDSYVFETRLNNFISGTVVDFRGKEIVWKGVGLGTLNDHVINVAGSETTTSANVATATEEYATSITLDTNPFAVGDIVQVNPDDSTTTSVYARYVFRVEGVDGLTIRTDYPLLLPLGSDGVTVTKLNPVQDVKILNVKMRAEGQTSRSVGIGAVHFFRTVNCLGKNISSTGFWFKTCKSGQSLRTFFKDIYTYEPAAIAGGGEGYGVQFEYSYKSGVLNSRSFNSRHCVDFTASGYCLAQDCYSSNSFTAGFLTHKANEYEITFERCHSFGDISGFALGGLDSGFADMSSNIKVLDSSAINFVQYGLAYVQKSRGLKVNGFRSRPANPDTFTGDTILVSNADVSLSNIDTHGKVRIRNQEGATADGFVTIHASTLKELPVNRALSCIDNGRVKVFGSTINGRMDLLTNGQIELLGSDHIARDIVPFSGDGTGVVEYNGGSFEFGPDAASYNIPAHVVFNNCKVARGNPGAALISKQGTLRVTGNCEDLRATVTGGDIELNGARITGRITTSGHTGRLTIAASYVGGIVTDLGSGSYRANISNSEFGSNLIVGNANTGHIVDNSVEGGATLPVATATLIVRDNI